MQKKQLNQISPLTPDFELARIRELPLRSGFIDANNPMYQMYQVTRVGLSDFLSTCFLQTPTDEELEVIPKIKRCQLTLTKFLGSGAFGEVNSMNINQFNIISFVLSSRFTRAMFRSFTSRMESPQKLLSRHSGKVRMTLKKRSS